MLLYVFFSLLSSIINYFKHLWILVSNYLILYSKIDNKIGISQRNGLFIGFNLTIKKRGIFNIYVLLGFHMRINSAAVRTIGPFTGRYQPGSQRTAVSPGDSITQKSLTLDKFRLNLWLLLLLLLYQLAVVISSANDSHVSRLQMLSEGGLICRTPYIIAKAWIFVWSFPR